jgi:hypothetical protein
LARIRNCVPEHMRVSLEDQLRHLANSFKHAGEPGCGERRATLRRVACITGELAPTRHIPSAATLAGNQVKSANDVIAG